MKQWRACGNRLADRPARDDVVVGVYIHSDQEEEAE